MNNKTKEQQYKIDKYFIAIIILFFFIFMLKITEPTNLILSEFGMKYSLVISLLFLFVKLEKN